MMRSKVSVSTRVRTEAWLWRHGWAWPLAAMLAVAALALHFLVLRPERARLSVIQSALKAQALAPASRERPHAKPIEAADPRGVIASSPSADQVVAQMVKLARAEGIALPQSEYRQGTGEAAFAHVQISQPVRAAYPQLRRYIESVLRTLPNASLDQLSARRENVAQPQLEARLRWSVWLPRLPHGEASLVNRTPVQEKPTP